MPFEQALTEEKIPFHYVNKSGFFSRPEVQTTLCYAGCCLFPANHLITGTLRMDFHPTKFLPRSKMMARLKELKQDDKDISYWHLLTKEPTSVVDGRNLDAVRNFTQFLFSLTRHKDLSPKDALKQVFSSLKVAEYFAEQATIDNDPIQNLNLLLKIAEKYSSLKDFLDHCRRASAASKGKRGVSLATCHAAKGLEFHTVYLIGCQEGLFPHAKSDDLEGERNCFFVGCSRAERALKISYSGAPSPFISGIIEAQKKGSANESSS